MDVSARFRWVNERLRGVLKPAIAFEIWFTLIFLASLLPASGWLLKRLVARSGQFAVSDTDLLVFALSPPGLLFILLSVAFVLAFWFTEQVALLMIVLHCGDDVAVSVSRVLWENLKHLPALLRLAFRQGSIYLLAALPFLGGIALTHRLLLSEWDFYFYLNVQPPSWWVATSIVAALGAAYVVLAAWLYIRWVLSIPILLCEQTTPRQALRQSWRRTAGRFRELALPKVIGWSAVLLASALMSWLIGEAAARVLGDSRSLTTLLPLVLTTVGLLVLLDFAWFVIGKILHVLLMTYAYLHTSGYRDLSAEAHRIAQPLHVGWRRTTWILVCGSWIFVAVAAGTAFLQDLSLDRDLRVTGHRGNKRRAPENTLAALQTAIDEGADYAEIDVQTTADGVVVLLHDADLMRVASVNRRLNAISHDELRSIDVGSWFDPAFRDERVPTLQEAIDLARGQIRLNIELKYTWEDPQLVESVGEIVRRNDFVSESVVSSLNFKALTEVRERFPELTTGFIVFQAVGDLSRMKADFLSLSAARATRRLVSAVHKRGGQVHAWTVNDLGNALSMIEMGVDNIITDEPALIHSVLAEWNGLSNSERLALLLRNLIVGLDEEEVGGL